MSRFHIRIADLTVAHGDEARFAWQGGSPQHLAQTIAATLRDTFYAKQWRDAQAEPDQVDAGLLATDADASVSSEDRAQQVEMVITTTLPHRVLAHRLNLLLGAHWTLRDVR